MEEKNKTIVTPFLKGERVDLCPTNVENAENYALWINNPEGRLYARNPLPRSIEEIKKKYEPSGEEMPEEITLEIFHKEDNKPIGLAGFLHINWLNRNANLFINIGEKEYWGRGLAEEVAKLVIQYGFEELNFHKIFTSVFAPNERSLRVAKKIGFVHECTLKEEIFVNGEYVDREKYALFKRDWLNKQD